MPPEVIPRDETREQAVNLLPLVEPDKDAVLGTWTIEGGALVSERGEATSLEFPYAPPEEYDFRIVFARTEGSGDVLQRLFAAGRSFTWMMGAENNSVFAFGPINGEWADGANPSIVRARPCIENGRVHTSRIQVRTDGVKAFFDGRLVAEWKTDYADLGPTTWIPKIRQKGLLAVGAWRSRVVFHQLELVEVTGQGARTRATVPVLAPRAGLPPESAWAKAVNLLALSDPRADAVEGAWTPGEGTLRSDASRHARLAFPYRPPDEYDLRVIFTRESGQGDVNLLLSAAGRPFLWMMGGYENRVFGFELIRNEHANANPTTVRETACLENGRTYTAVLQVRKDGVQAFLDGRPLSQWRTDYSDMGIHREWRLPAGAALGLGCFQSPTTFHRAELLALNGRGAPLRLEPPAFKAARVPPSPLAPGLMGEYFQGTNFESLALRRVDPAVAFRWEKGPPWSGGPADGFSCRWTGFLRVPKTGVYRLAAHSDDGLRIRIGGALLLNNWSIHTETLNAVECHLEEGFHPIAIEHFDERAEAVAVLAWAAGNEPPSPVGPEHLFHRPADFQPFAAPSRSPHLLHTLEGHGFSVWSVAVSPDGTRAASGSYDKTIRLWDLEAGKEIRAARGHNGTVTSLAFRADGARLLSGSWDNTLALWDVATGERVRLLEGHRDRVQSVALSPDGKRALSGSWDKTMALWDVETGQRVRVFEGHQDRVYSVSFSPDGARALSAGWDQAAFVWDLESGQKLLSIAGHRAKLQSARFSPDGRTIATGGRDNAVRLWDAETGAEKRALLAHTGEIMSVAFSPDGKRILSGSNDQTLRLWEAETGREIRALFGHTGYVECVTFFPDGSRAASAGSDRTVRIWSVAE